MASDNMSDCRDEKAALVETGSEQASGLQQQCEKRSESKMMLYHWTQSFNSQKVSGSDVSALQRRGQLPVFTAHVCVAGVLFFLDTTGGTFICIVLHLKQM